MSEDTSNKSKSLLDNDSISSMTLAFYRPISAPTLPSWFSSITSPLPDCSNNVEERSPERKAPRKPRHTPYPSPNTSRRVNQMTASCPFSECGSHMKLHKQGKPFRCVWPGCGTGYVREDDHKQHEKEHNGSLGRYSSPPGAETPEMRLMQQDDLVMGVDSQQNDTSVSKEDGTVKAIFGACGRCKHLQVKCEYDADRDSCKRCLNGDHDCQWLRVKRALEPKRLAHVPLRGDPIIEEDGEFEAVGSSSSEAEDTAVKQPRSEGDGTRELLNITGQQAAQIDDMINELDARRGSATRSPSSSPLPFSVSSVVPTSPQPYSLNISDNRQTEVLIARLTQIFATKDQYRSLLSCRGRSAQKLLNMFQRLLDLMDNQPTSIHRNLIAATQRLAGASGLYPTCYELNGVTDTGIYECSGGFADVYKAYFRGHAVCLKTIRLNSRTDSEHFLKVFSKEAILWGQLRHPNILPFYGIYRIKDRISFVAPWMENGDVSKFLKLNQSSNRVLLCFDIAQGLHFLHKNDIVHGDLKSGNILVNEFGRACLADLGLSSISDKEILIWTSYSSVASKGGTVRWQAPELFNPEGEEDIHNSKASDIYAWACVAYEVFTGNVPLAHLARDATIMHKVLRGERPKRPPGASLSWNVWGLTEEIWTLMESCWDSDPAQRPDSSVVIENLEAALPKDIQSGAQTVSMSPGQFREMTRDNMDGIDELSGEILARFIGTS